MEMTQIHKKTKLFCLLIILHFYHYAVESEIMGGRLNVFSRPFGTLDVSMSIPALKRRDILTRPSGTNT